nr:retrovirus-related Pol polyprotein from transposon TNT 1-94 [Tanacetum cinerariifolium]
MVKKSKLDEDPQGKAIDPTRYRAFVDADHVGCQDTRKSTSGSMQLLGDRLLNYPVLHLLLDKVMPDVNML